MSDGNIIEIEQPDGDKAMDTAPDKQALAFAAQACDGKPSQNTDEMRAKARALSWLADLLERDATTGA